MYKLGKNLVASIALLLVISITLAACGGSATPAPSPTNTPAAAAAATPTVAAMAAPTNTTAAMAAATDTPAAMGAMTPTEAMAAPTDTTTSSNSGNGGNGGSTGNPDADLLKTAAGNMKALKSFHMDVATTAAGQNVTLAADVDVANNKLKMDTNTAGQSISIIVTNNNAYMSSDGGKTYTASPAAGSMTQSLSSFIHMWDNYNSTSMPTTATNAIKDAGNEQVDGVDTKHLTVDSSLLSGAASSSTGPSSVDIWVSNDANPTIRQMKVTATAAGQTTNVTVKWSKFNEDLNIPNPTGN